LKKKVSELEQTVKNKDAEIKTKSDEIDRLYKEEIDILRIQN
jgi:hypothetical protein